MSGETNERSRNKNLSNQYEETNGWMPFFTLSKQELLLYIFFQIVVERPAIVL